MRQITININNTIYEHIMFFLKSLPQNLIRIKSEKEVDEAKTLLTQPKNEAFGILKGQIADPVAWQTMLREESDRDIYGTLK